MIFFLFLLHTVTPLHITVDSDGGKDSPYCLTAAVSCQSLEYVAKYVSNTTNVTVEINSTSLTLEESVLFTEVNGLTLIGQGPEMTTISCNGSYTKKGYAAGIAIKKCSQIKLGNFSIKNCGALYHYNNFTQLVSIAIEGSTDITMTAVNVTKSIGRGIGMVGVSGTIDIGFCHFWRNGVTDRTLRRNSKVGEGGLLILLHGSTAAEKSSVTIHNCSFMHNEAHENSGPYGSWNSQRHGGGLLLLLTKGATEWNIKLLGCMFRHNKAPYAAGFKILIRGKCMNNSIHVESCTFRGNKASIGGGGIDIGFETTMAKSEIPQGNKIVITECKFVKNIALFGGGLGLYTAAIYPLKNLIKNSIKMISCHFSLNEANGGSAVSIKLDEIKSDGYLLSTNITFDSCIFFSNNVVKGLSIPAKATDDIPTGTLFTSEVAVSLSGYNVFDSNNGSALYSSSTMIIFTRGSETLFVRNKGEKGGAILLIGHASLKIDRNSRLQFRENVAVFGGAICALRLETYYLGHSGLCFIDIKDPKTVSMSFENNNATMNIANDIFISDIRQCQRKCAGNRRGGHHISIHSIFTPECIGNVTFTSNKSSLASVTERLITDKYISPFPGVPFKMNVTQLDCYKNDVSELFPFTVRMKLMKGPIRIDTGYVIITDDTIKLYGEPGRTGKLILQSYRNTYVHSTTKVTLSFCSPGYVLDTHKNTCMCAANDAATQFDGIPYCINGSAVLQVAKWAGYLNGSLVDGLVTAGCKAGLCSRVRHKHLTKTLDNVCHKNRDGVLCTQCLPGYTTYYHSNMLLCKKNSHCRYGFALYILTELLPITLLFVMILILNINITSGSVNSFIFYAQVISTLYVDAFGAIDVNMYSKVIGYFFAIYRLFFGFFNFSIMEIDRFSFCLFKDANIMDLLLVKYFTTLYALFLIFVTILFLRLYFLYPCIKLCHKFGRRNIRGSVINGLTAFLVLSYYQCVEITTKILTPSEIKGEGGRARFFLTLYAGHIEFMSSAHLKYAIPALLCLVVIILPPPIILLSEPLLVQLSGLINMRRNAVSYYLQKLRMKLKPFLDSFQGCFKDKCRCFAGLFFLYRIIAFAPSAVSTNIESSYLEATILLFTVFLLHSLIHPYQKNWHNYIDLFLLANITMVTMVTTINYYLDVSRFDYSISIVVLLTFQLVLVSLPVVYIGLYFLYHIFRKCVPCRNKIRARTMGPLSRFSNVSMADDSLPDRLLHEETGRARYGSLSS